jgi:hypothetical protein
VPLEIVIVAVLFLISVQDFGARSVYWVMFPMVLLLLLAEGLSRQHRSLTGIAQTTLVNWAFLGLQFLMLSLYFSLKNRRWVNITKEMLGWGDILLLLCVALYLSVLNFLFFYIVSLIGSLLIWLSGQAIAKQKNNHIPLAGLQAVFLNIFLMLDWYWLHLNLTDDAWILNLIHR